MSRDSERRYRLLGVCIAIFGSLAAWALIILAVREVLSWF